MNILNGSIFIFDLLINLEFIERISERNFYLYIRFLTFFKKYFEMKTRSDFKSNENFIVSK